MVLHGVLPAQPSVPQWVLRRVKTLMKKRTTTTAWKCVLPNPLWIRRSSTCVPWWNWCVTGVEPVKWRHHVTIRPSGVGFYNECWAIRLAPSTTATTSTTSTASTANWIISYSRPSVFAFFWHETHETSCNIMKHLAWNPCNIMKHHEFWSFGCCNEVWVWWLHWIRWPSVWKPTPWPMLWRPKRNTMTACGTSWSWSFAPCIRWIDRWIGGSQTQEKQTVDQVDVEGFGKMLFECFMLSLRDDRLLIGDFNSCVTYLPTWNSGHMLLSAFTSLQMSSSRSIEEKAGGVNLCRTHGFICFLRRLNCIDLGNRKVLKSLAQVISRQQCVTFFAATFARFNGKTSNSTQPIQCNMTSCIMLHPSVFPHNIKCPFLSQHGHLMRFDEIRWDLSHLRYHFPLRIVAAFVLPSLALFHQPRDPRLERCGFHHCQCVCGGYLDSDPLWSRWYSQGPRLRATSQLTCSSWGSSGYFQWLKQTRELFIFVSYLHYFDMVVTLLTCWHDVKIPRNQQLHLFMGTRVPLSRWLPCCVLFAWCAWHDCCDCWNSSRTG